MTGFISGQASHRPDDHTAGSSSFKEVKALPAFVGRINPSFRCQSYSFSCKWKQKSPLLIQLFNIRGGVTVMFWSIERCPLTPSCTILNTLTPSEMSIHKTVWTTVYSDNVRTNWHPPSLGPLSSEVMWSAGTVNRPPGSREDNESRRVRG